MNKRDFLSFGVISGALLAISSKTHFFDLSGHIGGMPLKEYGGPTGEVTPFKNGTYSDVYFGAYVYAHALELNISCPNLAKFIAWSASLQTKDGFFDKVCKNNLPVSAINSSAFLSCGRADSHDATLSKWLELFELQPMEDKYLHLYSNQVKKAQNALFSLKRKNGLFGVFPKKEKGYENYCLFKDNIEVLRYFKIKSKSDITYVKHYTDLLAAIKSNFGDDLLHPKVLAVGANYASEMFYPHKVAGPFVILENVLSQEESNKFNWDSWLAENQQAWDSQGKKDYPWGLVAVAAMQSNRPDIAKKWLMANYDLEKNAPKPGLKWNILEEFSALAISQKLGLMPNKG